MTRWPIGAPLVGDVGRFGPDGEPSAIDKHPSDEPLELGWTGFTRDQQGDLSVHGGPDKALHHYPADHYPYWQETLNQHSLLNAPGAFGENIATTGLLEDAACIGDQFALGSAIVEISQGRQPCWKLGHRFGDTRVPALVVRTGRSGWYYRVIQCGIVAPGDTLTLLDRPYPQWSVAHVFALLIGGKAKQDPAQVAALTTLSVLATSWVKRAHALSQAD